MDIKKGETILITEGEYSDFRVKGIYKALIDINIEENLQAFAVYNGAKDLEELKDFHFQAEKELWDFFIRDEYIEYLLNNGYVETIKYTDCHLGSYGSMNVSISKV